MFEISKPSTPQALLPPTAVRMLQNDMRLAIHHAAIVEDQGCIAGLAHYLFGAPRKGIVEIVPGANPHVFVPLGQQKAAQVLRRP